MKIKKYKILCFADTGLFQGASHLVLYLLPGNDGCRYQPGVPAIHFKYTILQHAKRVPY
jgi:hypothetical protein